MSSSHKLSPDQLIFSLSTPACPFFIMLASANVCIAKHS